MRLPKRCKNSGFAHTRLPKHCKNCGFAHVKLPKRCKNCGFTHARLPTHYKNCGFTHVRLPTRCKNCGFEHDVELVLLLKSKRIKIRELPVKWTHKNSSSLNILWDPIKMLVGIFLLKFRKF